MPPIKNDAIPVADANTTSSTGTLRSRNNTVTVRTNIPSTNTSAPATAFPVKLEQVRNVDTTHGLPDKSILQYDRASGMWRPVPGDAGNNLVSKRFDFSDDSLEWLVVHNLNTRSFFSTTTSIDGTKFAAKTKILDENSFVVVLTSATSGWVDVIFTL